MINLRIQDHLKTVRYTFGSNRYGKLGRDADADAAGTGVVSVEASDGHRPAVASIALGGRKPKPESRGGRWWLVGWLAGWLVGLVWWLDCFFFSGVTFLKGALLHLKWQSKVEKKRQKKLQEIGNCDWLSCLFFVGVRFCGKTRAKGCCRRRSKLKVVAKKGRIFLACSENHQTQNSCLGRGYVNHPLGGSSQDRGYFIP